MCHTFTSLVCGMGRQKHCKGAQKTDSVGKVRAEGVGQPWKFRAAVCDPVKDAGNIHILIGDTNAQHTKTN